MSHHSMAIDWLLLNGTIFQLYSRLQGTKNRVANKMKNKKYHSM